MKDKQRVINEIKRIGIVSFSESNDIARGMMVRDDWVNTVSLDNIHACINCKHFEGSHTKGANITNNLPNDKCWSVIDGIECPCKKFVARGSAE